MNQDSFNFSVRFRVIFRVIFFRVIRVYFGIVEGFGLG